MAKCIFIPFKKGGIQTKRDLTKIRLTKAETDKLKEHAIDWQISQMTYSKEGGQFPDFLLYGRLQEEEGAFQGKPNPFVRKCCR